MLKECACIIEAEIEFWDRYTQFKYKLGKETNEKIVWYLSKLTKSATLLSKRKNRNLACKVDEKSVLEEYM